MPSKNNPSFAAGAFRPIRIDEIDGELLLALILPVVALLLFGWLELGLPLPKCVWHELTGIPCGGCGTTRALGTLLHGNPLRAFEWNPLAVLGMVGLALAWIYAALVCLFRWPRFRPVLSRRTGNLIRVAVVLLFVANWIYLITTLP